MTINKFARKPTAPATAAVQPLASTASARQFDALPDEGLIRLAQLIKSPKNPAPVVPVSASSVWRMVKAGDFPAPLKLGPKTTAWRVADIRRWLAEQEVTA